MSERYYEPTGGASAAPGMSETSERSLGEIVGEITTDLSTLMRQEIALARAEITEEAKKAGKGAGLLGLAGFAGYLLVVFLSLALMFALGALMPLGWAALIVAVLWGVVGFVAFSSGRKKMKTVSPMPTQTVETLKEDVQWAKHPTR